MGFLERASKGESVGSQSSDNEELYEKLFIKIGRDFVYKEDLAKMIVRILEILDPTGIVANNFIVSSEGAMRKALEYKKVLESGQDGSKLYKDLIILDED